MLYGRLARSVVWLLALQFGDLSPSRGDKLLVRVRVSGETPPADELIELAGQHLARYKLPRAVVFVDQMVRSPSGKPDYRWAKATATSTLQA